MNTLFQNICVLIQLYKEWFKIMWLIKVSKYLLLCCADLASGVYVPVINSGLCHSVCSSVARCACGLRSGQYHCLCPPGHYGLGTADQDSPCLRQYNISFYTNANKYLRINLVLRVCKNSEKLFQQIKKSSLK